MCIPLAAVAIATSAISAATSAYGAEAQASAQSAAAKFSSKTEADQAVQTANASQINEQQTYRQGDQAEGLARAATGANGVNVNAGTALQTQKDIGERTGQNLADQDYNTHLARWGALSQSNLLTSQSQFDQQAGNLSAAGGLINSASQISAKWAGFQQQGVFSGSGASDASNIAGQGSPAGWGSNGGSVGVGSWA